ncbi:MAG: primosomal protein N' [Candidatus Symbiothrix sp.]|jgi:primosomal protein N' (replication factor Y)|nr:primosomal protein N' [Candidatus Symbiothrix sp.]
MYIEVILPVPLADSYTYFVPPEMEAQIGPGVLVTVEFGKSKKYSGIVGYIRQIPPESLDKIKPILAVETEQPVVRRPQIRLWEWLSQYYLCKLGEVYHAAIPSGLRSDSSLAYSARKETFVRLSANYGLQVTKQRSTSVNYEEAFRKIKRSAKQEQLLLAFIQHSHAAKGEIAKKELLAKCQATGNVLNGLIEKGILETFEKEISRLPVSGEETEVLNTLNDFQQKAYSEIVESFREKDVCLLHGVTSAGKTEIYTHLIAKTLEQNRQVLFLLPEIALTAQITKRLKKFYGDKLGVYHSKVNENERIEIWNNLLTDSAFPIILGVRSSVFLPFQDLGLIIVDEEHEPSYKQQDPAPRYHARNVAIVLARMHGAKVVLGSATPSIESFYNARTGKYGYVQLNKRFEETELPLITPVDVKELRRKKKMKTLFSPLLVEKMQTALAQGEQVLLFHNRRGFSPTLVCKICDWTPKCKYCDISLSYHKYANHLTCHYCGRVYKLPHKCPECESTELKPWGFGTEKVEDEIRELFPDISVARMDSDTTRNKKSSEEIISRFESGETQILIGTQMISKGLDFEKVSLAGILSADSLMNFPDFRAYERAYQLMAQVAGRTGRRKTRGEVILQTSHPEHPLIGMVLNHDYEGMYEMQSEERLLFHYPPYFRLINIDFKHRKEDILREAAAYFAGILREKLGDRVMGPDKPAVGRVQNWFIRRILLKIEATASIHALREILDEAQNRLAGNPDFKYTVVQYDVDPV